MQLEEQDCYQLEYYTIYEIELLKHDWVKNKVNIYNMHIVMGHGWVVSMLVSYGYGRLLKAALLTDGTTYESSRLMVTLPSDLSH